MGSWSCSGLRYWFAATTEAAEMEAIVPWAAVITEQLPIFLDAYLKVRVNSKGDAFERVDEMR
jgi:hypothetical protein